MEENIKKNATPTAAVRNLENNCRNSSYAGCTKCLGALQKVKGYKNETKGSDRVKKMFNRDCQLMGLTSAASDDVQCAPSRVQV
ncbi:Putative GPI-anchored protein [Glycine soja]|nr:Putative GPI-anchored protein [Glycine soja]